MEPTKPKNLLVELAKKQAAEQAAGKRFQFLGEDLNGRQSKRIENRSYTWRGGRNGQGKP